MIDFACPECGKKLRAPDAKVGALARCPQCGRDVTIPAARAATPPPAEPATAAPAPGPAKPSAAARLVRLVLGLVLIAVVLAASLWGGMVWRAGGIDRAPKTFNEFWDRLTQQPAK